MILKAGLLAFTIFLISGVVTGITQFGNYNGDRSLGGSYGPHDITIPIPVDSLDNAQSTIPIVDLVYPPYFDPLWNIRPINGRTTNDPLWRENILLDMTGLFLPTGGNIPPFIKSVGVGRSLGSGDWIRIGDTIYRIVVPGSPLIIPLTPSNPQVI